MRLNKFVVGYDHSQSSQQALLWARVLAERFSAAVQCVFVYDPTLEKIRSLSLGGEFSEKLARSIEKEVKGVLDPKGLGKFEWSSRVERGRPAAVLTRYAAEIGADLIVMGTHGHTGYEKALLGSVSEKVLRKAHCPVWIQRNSSSAILKKILVPIDLSEISLDVLATAVDWAQALQSTLVILHVVDLSRYMPLPELDLFDVDFDPAQITQERKEVFEEFLAKAKKKVPALGKVEWRAESQVGSPVEQIVDFAKNEKSDLILIGSHERKVRKILLGSVAENVARYAPCSVLITRKN